MPGLAARCWRAAWSLLLLLPAVLLPPDSAAHDSRAELARQGVMELSAPDAAAFNHELRGEWRFAWRRFVDPGSTERLPGTAYLPASWNEAKTDGPPPGGDGYATYSLLVQCPAGSQLALSVPAQRSALHLYVNGKLAASQGRPGMVAEQAVPAIGGRAVLTEPFPCPLRIVAHVSNYSHRAGGMVQAPVAGPLELLAQESQQRMALDTILLGATLVVGLSGVIFYLGRRKDATPLLAGLFCLVYTVYSDMAGGRQLLQLGGAETPWEVYQRIEYLAWFGALALFPLMVDKLFARSMHPVACRLAVALCGLGALVVAITPARIYTQLVHFGVVLGAVIGAYTVFVLARALRQGRQDAGVLLAGMGFLLLALVLNLLQFYTGVALRSITLFGQLAFVLSAPLVLLRSLVRLLNAEELSGVEQREKVDLLVRTTQAGIVDWDYTRSLTRYSPRMLEILGYPPDTGTEDWPPFFELVHPGEREMLRELFLDQLRDRSVRNAEKRHEPRQIRLLRRDGSAVWVHAESISLRGSDGRTLRYISSMLDVTEQRAVAEGLKRQNAALAENARLREDVERMSRHDLKTPLNSIIGVARLLREDVSLQPEQRELLGISERAGYRMLEMVNLSLDLSRMELGSYDFRPQAVNLVDVVARLIVDLGSQAEAARVQVQLEHAFTRPVYARAEELLCYSILANLLKNAIEATPPGGMVRIGIEPGEPVRVRVRNPGRVPAAVAGKFFDKYVTAGKSGGTGLGTYSALLMARVQQGELNMATGEDGTLLTLSLRALGAEQLPVPRLPGFARPAPVASLVAATDFAPRRLVVADDDEYNRLLLLRYLPSPPFTVETAANGLAATEAMARQWPDIVLIDMEMPVMNGLEAVAWIRERERREARPPCLVLMMSSNDDPVSIRRGLAAGSNRYLTKPFTREALLHVIRELDAGAPPVPMQVPLELEEPARAPADAPDLPDAPVKVDGELLQEVPAFLESRRRMVAAMGEALAAGKRGELRAVAHRAAGGLALFGFHWAAWQSRRISLQAAEGLAEELRQDISRLHDHLRDVQVQ